MSTLKERKELLDSFIESVAGDEPQAQTQGKALLDKDVSEMLLSDLETKLCEIIQEAKKTMRHSKRHVLTTSDIDAAFKKLTIKVSEFINFGNRLMAVRTRMATLRQCHLCTRKSAMAIATFGSLNQIK